MAVARKILGPQEQFERTGAQGMRDVRPFTTRLSEGLRSSASGLVLAILAGVTYFEPAALDLTVPLSGLYALWVLTRTVKLPGRVPGTATCLDYSNLEPGTRKPKPAGATWFLGWDIHGHELWVTPEDVRQHIAIPGTTGAGKTTAIRSLLVNALAQGSGFVFVDGKADRGLFSQVFALARRFGREDDLRVLNFPVASDVKDSNSFNPFSVGNADTVRELWASQLGEKTENDANGVFRDRAVALIGTIAPVLVWLRDHKGIPLNIEVIRFSIELRWIWKLAMERIVLLRDPQTGDIRELDVADEVPEDIVWPLRSYLGELPGYDPALPLDKQKGEEPSKQHGFAQFYFTATFTQLAVSLGHIFRVDCGDIDMRDIVLNRRILVVNLPALENSDATLAALGKLVVASLRGMMAQLLGVSLDGDYEGEKAGMGPAPFPIVLDELAYYATSGLDRMLAQGRSLNISFILGFQELSGIWARLGEKTASLLGNSNITIAMRQQESGRTRDWLDKTAGQTYATQATSYQGAPDGAYREARHAEVRPVSRIDWNDLTSLEPGEAIVLFGGRRIYARVFHAKIDDAGWKRLGRTIMLPLPDRGQVQKRLDRADAMAGLIERGALTIGQEEEVSPALGALIGGFARAAQAGSSGDECARSALQLVSELPEDQLPPRPTPPADGTPVTAVSPMLVAASAEPIAGPDADGRPGEPIDVVLVRRLIAIETASGLSASAARAAAMLALTERDEGLLRGAEREPPAMSAEAFVAALRAVLLELGDVRARFGRRKAA